MKVPIYTKKVYLYGAVEYNAVAVGKKAVGATALTTVALQQVIGKLQVRDTGQGIIQTTTSRSKAAHLRLSVSIP